MTKQDQLTAWLREDYDIKDWDEVFSSECPEISIGCLSVDIPAKRTAHAERKARHEEQRKLIFS